MSLAGHRDDQGQAILVLLAAIAVLMVAVSSLGSLGKALLERGRVQRTADLSAVSAARSMRDDFERLFEPAVLPNGAPNPRHMSKLQYLLRARRAAVGVARRNGERLGFSDVRFPDAASFAPTRVKVVVRAKRPLRAGIGKGRRHKLGLRATAEAEVAVLGGANLLQVAEGGGYTGKLAYRQGKSMRPDVALAFDRLDAAARSDGVSLLITSGYRSDTEQARLFAENPDPRMVAPPGKSLHRNATELDIGPPSAYGWLARNASRFHFTQRYSWEPWHYGYTLNARSTPDRLRGAGVPGDGRSALPGFVPKRFAGAITKAASRWSVSSALLAAQLYAESNFNPFAVSSAGAQGIAQFMPATARAYGLKNPFSATQAIQAQAHHMRDLLRRFGSISLALAAYNAGAGAVERCGCVPSYPETQAYVAKILGLMNGAGDLAGLTSAVMEVRLVE